MRALVLDARCCALGRRHTCRVNRYAGHRSVAQSSILLTFVTHTHRVGAGRGRRVDGAGPVRSARVSNDKPKTSNLNAAIRLRTCTDVLGLDRASFKGL
eukprot:5199898-Prymnesium_polylepis.1